MNIVHVKKNNTHVKKNNNRIKKNSVRKHNTDNRIAINDVAKKCNMHINIQIKFSKRKRIVAIGDIHGDYKLAIKLLTIAKVIKVSDDNIEWIGDDTIVVQTGDQLDGSRILNAHTKNGVGDKEKSDIKVFELFTNLDLMARKYKGKVISLIGNHEIKNVVGDTRYVSQHDAEYFGNIDDRIDQFKPGNKFSIIIGCTRLLCVMIGSNFFCHAGIIKKFIDELKINEELPIDTLSRINNIMKEWLIYGETKHKDIVDYVSSDYNSIIINRTLGLIKDNMTMNDEECSKYVYPSINLLSINNVIVGHTPQITMNSTCDGSVWRIDEALSEAFDSLRKVSDIYKHDKQYHVLEICDDKIFRILS